LKNGIQPPILPGLFSQNSKTVAAQSQNTDWNECVFMQ